jgi:hypothetical protein
MIKDKFYVYILLDPNKSGSYNYEDYKFEFEPFYIGKGSGDRAFRHTTKKVLNDNCNSHKKNKINKILKTNKNPIVLLLFENLNENEAFEKENKLIQLIGRSDLNFGPLTNKTNGGDGGVSGRIVSIETREKLKKANIGKKNKNKGKKFEEIYGKEKGNKIREKLKLYATGKSNIELYGFEKTNQMKINSSNSLKGIVKNEEWRLKLSNSHKGKKLNEETRKKISKSLLGNKRAKGHIVSDKMKKKISEFFTGVCSWNAISILQFDKNLNFIKEWRSAHDAAKELGLSQGNICSVLHNKRKSCGGYIWKLKQ